MKTFSCKLLIFLFFSISAFAQKDKLDSLVNLKRTYIKEDARKADLLNQLAFIYAYMQFDSAEIYYNKAIALSLKLNNRTVLAETYTNKGLFLQAKSKFNDAILLLKKAIAINTEIENLNGLAHSYCNIGSAYFQVGNDSAAIDYLTRGLNLFVSLKDEKGMAWANSFLGIYYSFADFEKSKSYFLKAIEGRTKTGE
jgi:tetratricopeptide (TPR) repeat protein